MRKQVYAVIPCDIRTLIRNNRVGFFSRGLTDRPVCWENTQMPMFSRSIILLTLLMLGVLLTGLAADPVENRDKAERVILRVSRNLTVMGYVQLEEDDVIVVRDLSGEVQSFAKDKILHIIRLVEPEPNQRGIIVFLDGQTQEAIIIKDDFNNVVFEVDGIRSTLRRMYVDYVTLKLTFEEQYRLYKQRLTPEMHQAQFRFCQWLFDEEKYTLAKKELEDLLKKTDMSEAIRLRTFVDAQLLLDRNPSGDPAGEGGMDSASPESTDENASGIIPVSKLMPDHILTREEVNLIRVMEIDFRKPPKISIKPETVRRFIETYREDRRVPITPDGQARLFRTAANRPIEFLRLLFELRARELYGEVEVLTEPLALNLFRRRVHNAWLINNCATRHCHGGMEAGRFFLHRRGYKDDRVRYTNLLILDRLEIEPQWPLINYSEPTDSLIIQYALPRDLARKPHPEVRGWKAVFTRGNRRLLQETISWIQSMMHDPRPDYPIEYEPPKLNVMTSDGGPERPARPPR